MTNVIHRTIRRIMSRIRTEGECWIWQGCKVKGGYGQIWYLGGRRYVHCVTWEIRNGPIPKDLELDHTCRNRACCNPAHLEPVTHLENMRRGRWAQAKTCIRGHAFAVVGARRVCRECANRRNRDYRAKLRLAQTRGELRA